MPCQRTIGRGNNSPLPRIFLLRSKIVYRVLGVSLLPFPSQTSKKKKCPELKCRGKGRAFLWDRATSPRLVFSSPFSLSRRFSKSCGSVCVCVQKKKPVPFEPRYIGDDNGLVFSFYLGAADRSGKGKCSSSSSC